MGDRCEACAGPCARWVGGLRMALCAACERGGAGHPSREPVLVGEILAATADALTRAARTTAAVPDPRTPDPYTTCRDCGARADWHRTVRGRWMLVEPGALPVGQVPAGRRWRVAGDGTVVNLGSAMPSDTCRITHFDVCPSRPAPADSPVLLALWRRHAQYGV